MGEKVGIGGSLGSDTVVLAPGDKVMGCWFGAGLGDVTIGIWVISEAKSELSSLGMEVVVMAGGSKSENVFFMLAKIIHLCPRLEKKGHLALHVYSIANFVAS